MIRYWGGYLVGAALLAGGALRAADIPVPGCIHHLIEQKSLGTYAVFPPPGYDAPENRTKTYPLCVILHASGSNEMADGLLSNHLGRDDVLYIAPRSPYLAPRAPVPMWSAMPRPAGWENIDFQKEETKLLRQADTLQVDWISACIADARRRYRITDDRAVLIGHSEGAAFAHLFACDHPEQVKAYFAYAGDYDTDPRKDCAAVLKMNRTYPCIVQGLKDPMQNPGSSRTLVARLKEAGVPHEAFFDDDAGHHYTPRVFHKARQFVRKWCLDENLPDFDAPRGELHVLFVFPGMAGKAAGLQAGDIIRTYAGAHVSDTGSYVQAMTGQPRTRGAKMDMTVTRGGKTLTLSVPAGQLGVAFLEQ